MVIVTNGKATIKITPKSRRIMMHIYLPSESGLSHSCANFIVMHKQIRLMILFEQTELCLLGDGVMTAETSAIFLKLYA